MPKHNKSDRKGRKRGFAHLVHEDDIDKADHELSKKKSKAKNVRTIYDFFVAGTETSSTTLKWILLYLSLHQEVQHRAR